MKNFFKRKSEPKTDYRNHRDEREMFTVTCADCGNSCQVPFKPKGGKTCFFAETVFQKITGIRRMTAMEEENILCTKQPALTAVINCEVPFKPSKDKQIYCSRCFSQGGSSAPVPRKSEADYSKQFDDVNRKLDKILRMLAEKGLVGEKEE